MGAITGYFSAAVGMLFVIAGIIGIISAAFPGRKALAVFVNFKNAKKDFYQRFCLFICFIGLYLCSFL